ncbi:MAG: cation diffusion facilitator family transporter [Clostridiales bacterium]|nr:cation diffusion facilitator family transporter [Clostridiales bacterium]
MDATKRKRIAMKVSWISIGVNVALSAFKLFAGIVAMSSAMVADAVHSASDVCGTVIVMAGVKMSSKESDKEHQYGHERMECVAAILLSVILFLIGIGIGYSGVNKIIGIAGGNYHAMTIPGLLALIAAVTSVAMKEGMYWYTRSAAKKIDSVALMAEAWHHRSDALSSVGSFAGILGARLGYPVLDPVACVVICIFILKAAYDIFMDAVGKLTDRACDDQCTAEITAIVNEHEGVLGIDQLKTRLFGDKIYVDLEIGADGNSTLNESHDIAEKIHDEIESRVKNVKHCMVHVNPKKAGE